MYQPVKQGRERARRVVEGAGYKVGGQITPRDDREADVKLIKRAFEEHDSQLHGGKKTKLRLRHGGRAEGGMAQSRADQQPRRSSSSKKGPHSQVNIVVAGQRPQGAPGAPPAGPPAMPPPAAMPPHPAPPPPPMPPPAMGAGMPPGGMPPRPPMPGGGPPPGAAMGMGMPGQPIRPPIKTGGRSGWKDGGGMGLGGAGANFDAGSGTGEGREEKRARMKPFLKHAE